MDRGGGAGNQGGGALVASAQVYTWRTAAVGVWAMAIVSWAAQAWSLDWPSLLSLRPWRVAAPLLGAETLGLVVLLGLACSPAALIHISLLRVSEPRPLLPSNSSGPAATLSRALGRLRTATEFLQCCIFIGTSMLSGSVFLEAFVLLRAKGSAPEWNLSIAAGATLGLVHSCKYLVRGRDVLSFPVIQRSRIFRVKQSLPSAAATATRTSASALLASTALQWLLPSVLPPLSARSAVLLLLGMSLLAFSWEVVALLVATIFTERVRFDRHGGANPLSTLLACLKASKQPIMQEFAFLDVCCLAEQRGGASWLRSAVFADEVGTTWAAVMQPCIEEVRQLTAAIAEALPQQQALAEAMECAILQAGAQGGTQSKENDSTARWNVSAKEARVAGVSAKRHAAVSWHIRSRHHRLELCIRTLAAMVAASRTEDVYGVAQLCNPGLGDCLVALLSALGALRLYVKLTCSVPSSKSPWASLPGAVVWVGNWATKSAIPSGALSMQEVDTAAYSMEDIVRTGVHNLVCTFGDELIPLLQSCKGAPPYGSRADLEAWLKSCMQGPF